MPVSYISSNLGRRHEPPHHQIQDPYQYQDHGYGYVNRNPYQDHGSGSVSRDPYQSQDHGYGYVNRNPYQDHGSGSVSRDPYQFQDQDHGYGPVNRNPFQNHCYGPVNWDPYQDPPPYMPFPRGQSQISDSTEWNETPEAHVYMTHLPGAKRNDVVVEVEDDKMMVINCYMGVEESTGHHALEAQRVMLPDNSNVGQMRAFWENGVLIVTVPKLNRFVNRYGWN